MMIEERKKQYVDFLLCLTNNVERSNELAVKLAQSDVEPDSFRLNHPTFFTEFGDVAKDWQSIYFMIDALEKLELAYRLDWKADYEEMNEAILLLSQQKIKDIVDEEDEEECDSMYDLIDIAIENLEDIGYTLFQFPGEDDNFPIALIEKEKGERLEELSAVIM